jgi:hypothetical protein
LQEQLQAQSVRQEQPQALPVLPSVPQARQMAQMAQVAQVAQSVKAEPPQAHSAAPPKRLGPLLA